jgi:sigma-B regulation protein RsbU (phosphoserine phosphatase)
MGNIALAQAPFQLDAKSRSWNERMALIVQMMREMSLQTDPQVMFRAYTSRVRQMLPIDRNVSLSRRGLERPKFRITRSNLWKEDVNPWKERDGLPLLHGGFLSELIYGNEPRIIDDLRYPDNDCAAEYLAGQRSLMAIPLYDQGVALNMVVLMRKEPGGFDPEQFPEWVWLSNLFGRATHNLVLSEELKKAGEDLKKAYDELDSEIKLIADIQRSLLPSELPRIPTMDLATEYQTSRRAGGDYYDFFPLPDGRWGIWIADVSGHGPPAAVLMAVTHSIAHAFSGPPSPPGTFLDHVNYHLATRYTAASGTFVTAFYGIYDPAGRKLTYACAGHNPPRWRRCRDRVPESLDGVLGLPLGISASESYQESSRVLVPGDQIVFYTDGIVEAANPAGEMFGLERLDRVLQKCPTNARDLLAAVLNELERFTAGTPAADDRTLVVATIS